MSLDIPDLTKEAQQLIAREELGLPLQIYSPPTDLNIMCGIVVLGCAAFMAWLFSVNINAAASGSAVMVLLFALFLAAIGLSMISIAIYNRKKRAVICTHGVALLTPEGSASFRWKDVLTTTRYVAPKKSLTYTVHCNDGRRIVFKNLSQINELAEAIDAKVARAQHP